MKLMDKKTVWRLQQYSIWIKMIRRKVFLVKRNDSIRTSEHRCRNNMPVFCVDSVNAVRESFRNADNRLEMLFA